MRISTDTTITTITIENETLHNFVDAIETAYKTFSDKHIIIDISTFSTLNSKDITLFLELSNTHSAIKKSFVIVTNSISLEDIPDELVIVPTLQEAYDIIEMEDIERDLGF